MERTNPAHGGAVPSSAAWTSRVAALAAQLAAGRPPLRQLPRAAWRQVRTEPFGTEPTGARLARILGSPHFAHGGFQNPVPTRRLARGQSRWERTRRQFAAGRHRRQPAAAVPLHRLLPIELAGPP